MRRSLLPRSRPNVRDINCEELIFANLVARKELPTRRRIVILTARQLLFSGVSGMRYLVAVLLFVWLAPVASYAHEYAPGDKVVVIHKRASIKLRSDVVAVGFPGLTLTVHDVAGELLSVHYKQRGWIDQSDVVPLKQAIEYLSRLVDQNRGDRTWLLGRAMVRREQGEFDHAIGDYTALIALEPKVATHHNGRGLAWKGKGDDDDEAIADFSEAIRLDPKFALVYNNLALLRATCPDARYRDGAKAIKFAEKACTLTGYKNANRLGTLAAAYAENGQFEQAVEMQEKAHTLYSQKDKEQFGYLRDLYRNRETFRPKK